MSHDDSTPSMDTPPAAPPAQTMPGDPEPAGADETLDELAPNGGGTSGNHGNGTAG